MKQRMLFHILAVLVLFALVSGCGPQAAVPTATQPPTAEPAPTATTVPPTQAPSATAWVIPTLTAVPVVEGSFPIGTYACTWASGDKAKLTLTADGRFNEAWEYIPREGENPNVSGVGVYRVEKDQFFITDAAI